MKMISLVLAIWLGSLDAQQLRARSSSNGESLGLKIMGSIIQKDRDLSVALVKEMKTGKVKAVKAGYSVLKDYKVVEVSAKYIVIERNSRQWLVFQDKFSSDFDRPTQRRSLANHDDYFAEEGFERRKDQITISASYKKKLIERDLAKILMQATAEPHSEGGKIVGFKMSQIDVGSIYWKSGLKDFDVITSINGRKLNSVGGAIGILKSLRSKSQIDVEILRAGSPRRLTVRVN